MEGFQNCNGGICIVGEYGEDHVTGTHRFRLTVESKGAGCHPQRIAIRRPARRVWTG
jgi:hypothetical protein